MKIQQEAEASTVEYMKSPGDQVCLGWGVGKIVYFYTVSCHQNDIEEGP